MFCRFFILRPALSIVISIVIIIAGIMAILSSPVAQYPDTVPPCINITASFPGANAEAIANAVAAPLEDQMAGVTKMIYMQSSSANGSSSVSLNVYFEVGTDLNSVLGDVLNRINTAMPQMPIQVQRQGVIVRKKSPDIFLVIPFFSDTGKPDQIFISNYVYRYIYPVISEVPGVGVVSIFGQRNYAMRVWLDPNKMAYYQLNATDIANAINDQNYQYAIGMNAMEPTDGSSINNIMINPTGYYTTQKQFENIVLKASAINASIVKLSDVARVSLDAQQYSTYFYRVGKDKNNHISINPAVALVVYLDPSANQLHVKAKINKELSQISKYLPTGIKWYYHYDTSTFVKDSIKEVLFTLGFAFILVFIVVLLFIQSIRGTLIPIIAIPVSIIGAFAGTYMLGFSINTLTLFGMVLAIGIVVDDAIVVLENVERLMITHKTDSLKATILAMEEVASPVIAIVLALNAVFIPVAFLGGFTGVLFKQFAVTIAISVFLSGVVALTLTPVLCVKLLKNVHNKNSGSLFFIKFNNGFDFIKTKYLLAVQFFLKHSVMGSFIFIIICLSTGLLYKIVPNSLIPLEDMGYYYTVLNSKAAAAMDMNLNEAKKVATYVESLPFISRIGILGGLDIVDNNAIKTSVTSLNTILNPYEERKNVGINEAIKINNQFNKQQKEVNAISFNQPPIRGLSPTGGVTFYLQATHAMSVMQVYRDSVKLVKYLESNYPAVANAKQFYDVYTPQLNVDVDNKLAKIYGLNIGDVYYNLQAVFGTYYVNYFSKWNDLYWVIMQADYSYRNNPELLNNIFVRNSYNKMVPVGSVTKSSYNISPEVVTRFNDYLASQIVVNPNINKHYTSGDVMEAINDAVPKVLGSRYAIKWFGPAYMQVQAQSGATVAIVLGLIMVFLILVALYELWLLPISVMMAVPFALLGAAITLFFTNSPNDLYFKISLLALIGLSAKNAILIVEFALNEMRYNKLNSSAAALRAAELRFRPIIMTSIAFIFGALPLILSSGVGANAEKSVGLGIIGGMLGSTFISTIFVPMFFAIIMKDRSVTPIVIPDIKFDDYMEK